MKDRRLARVILIVDSLLIPRGSSGDTRDEVPNPAQRLLEALFAWMDTSTRRDMKGAVIVTHSHAPSILEFTHARSGAKIYQFSVGRFALEDGNSNAAQISPAIARGHIGDIEYNHFQDFAMPIRVSNSPEDSGLRLDSKLVRHSSGGGFGKLITWTDSFRPVYEWQWEIQMDPEPIISHRLTPTLLVGPILGILHYEYDESSHVKSLLLPVLFETDADTTIAIEVRQIFSNTCRVLDMALTKRCPHVMRIGPLELNSRYSCRILSGIAFSESYDFTVSTFYSELNSNYAIINCNNDLSHPASYELVNNLVTRFRMPFHGVSALFHLNAGISEVNYRRKLHDNELTEELLQCRTNNSLNPSAKAYLSDLVESAREELRDLVRQPSYRELLRSAFNVFVVNPASRASSDISLLYDIILKRVHASYFEVSSTHSINGLAIGGIFEEWVNPTLNTAVPLVWYSPKRMVSLQVLPLREPMNLLLERIESPTVDSKLHIFALIDENLPNMLILSDLLADNSESGVLFQQSIQSWSAANPSRKLLLMSPHEEFGTCVKAFPTNDDYKEPLQLYLVDSIFRCNRYIHDLQLSEAEEQFRLVTSRNPDEETESLPTRKLTSSKQRQEEKILLEMKNRKSMQVWETLNSDGYWLIECSWIKGLSNFDATMDELLCYYVSQVASLRLDDIDIAFDLLQPPSWVDKHLPCSEGVFAMDEVVFYTRNSSEYNRVLAFIEDDDTLESLKTFYSSSYLKTLIDDERAFTENKLRLGLLMTTFVQSLWEITPEELRVYLSYFPDAFVSNYCLKGASFLEAAYSRDLASVSLSLQKALLNSVFMKSCMKMKNVRRWSSTLFADNARDSTAADIEADFGDSDIVDTEGAVSVEKGNPSGSFVDDLSAATEEERLARANIEVERRRTLKALEMSSFGKKLTYLNDFDFGRREALIK